MDRQPPPPSSSSAPPEDEVLEPSHPSLSTLTSPANRAPTRAARYTEDELSRKYMLKRQRGCRRCVDCGFWKYNVGFTRSIAKIGSPSYRLRIFRTCNHCSRLRKNLDEDEHYDLYRGIDVNP